MQLAALAVTSSVALLIIAGQAEPPGDVGLQLVEDGRASAVHLGLQVAPEAEVEEGEVGRSRQLLTFDQIL